MTFPVFAAGDVLAASDMNAVGLWKITTVTFNNDAAKSIDNVFSADYVNYKVVVQLYGSSNANVVFFRLINSTGTERATNYYGRTWGLDYTSNSATIYGSNTTTDLPIGYPSTAGNGQPLVADLLIGNPWSSSTRTSLAGTQTGINDGNWFMGGNANGVYLTAERHRGFWVRNTAATGLYGTVSVYGYRD